MIKFCNFSKYAFQALRYLILFVLSCIYLYIWFNLNTIYCIDKAKIIQCANTIYLSFDVSEINENIKILSDYYVKKLAIREEHVYGMYTDKLVEIEKIKILFSQRDYPHESFVKMLPQYDYAEAQLKLLKEQADNSRDLMEEIYNRVNEGYIKTSNN